MQSFANLGIQHLLRPWKRKHSAEVLASTANQILPHSSVTPACARLREPNKHEAVLYTPRVPEVEQDNDRTPEPILPHTPSESGLSSTARGCALRAKPCPPQVQLRAWGAGAGTASGVDDDVERTNVIGS